MTKNKKIDNLFLKFSQKIPNGEKGIKKDGIINEEIFDKQKVKILFICKEANDPSQKEGDFRVWWRKELFGIHANRIGTWAHGILENFPKIGEINREQKKKALSRIAFINLKKTGGKSKSDFNEILDHVKKTKNELLEQIEIINPTLIIGGITWFKLWEELFGKENISNIKNDTFFWKNRLIIHFFHPSARKRNDFLYEELKRKINSAHDSGS